MTDRRTDGYILSWRCGSTNQTYQMRFAILFTPYMFHFSTFHESVTDGRTDRRTDRPTDRRTDRRTDRPSYRDARTHLKTSKFSSVMNFSHEFLQLLSWIFTNFLSVVESSTTHHSFWHFWQCFVRRRFPSRGKKFQNINLHLCYCFIHFRCCW